MPVIMKENVQYAYTDKGVKAHTLSYAEYQALSTEEKMNGDLYFIPDKQPEGNPSLIWDKLGTATLDTDADNVSDAVNELNSNLTNLIKKTTVTGTTDASGNIGTFSPAYRLILGAYSDRTVNAEVISVSVTITASGTNYLLRCTNSQNAPVTNANVAVVVSYIDL